MGLLGVRGQMISTDDVNRMKELRRQGKSLREIGDAFDISYLTVRIHVDQEFGSRKARRRSIKYKGVKRPKPEECELCGTVVRLESHHWDDNNGNMSIYLCWDCHRYAEAVDYDEIYGENRREKYLAIKRKEEARWGDFEEVEEQLLPPGLEPPSTQATIDYLRSILGRDKE